jgi:hypothetical protein
MSTILISNVVLTLNPASINSTPSMPGQLGSSTVNLSVNGTFNTASGSYIGSYNNSFPLSSSDLTSSISDIDSLALAKVKAVLGL